MGIWVIKFALGTTWLLWLAAIAAPIVANINAVLTHLHVVPTALMICLIIGGVIALTKGVGRGIGIMASGFVVILLAAWLLRDPVTELTSPEGVLGMGRWLGFTVAMGVANNGPIVTDGSTINDAQVNQLTGWMVDVLARHSLQLMNFGQVIDARPGCADAWDAALMHNRTRRGRRRPSRTAGAGRLRPRPTAQRRVGRAVLPTESGRDGRPVRVVLHRSGGSARGLQGVLERADPGARRGRRRGSRPAAPVRQKKRRCGRSCTVWK